ncbi:MAG TPA: S41 family peptidase [Chloroflexia bacterium]|nr:S41 family peptidase [Chloroflexia bacterium]
MLWHKKRSPVRGRRGLAKKLAFLLPALIVLSIFLAACGSETVSLSIPTAQSGAALVPTGPTSTAQPTTVPATPTANPATGPIPTVTPQPTATPEPPTAAPAPTSTPEPEETPAASPAATAAPPTISAVPGPIDGAAELKVIKAAYDAINKHFYKQPDTAAIAQKALEQAASTLGVSPPGPQQWSDATTNWKLFEQQFNKLIAASKTQLPRGQLAHQVVDAMAHATGDLHTYFLDEKRTDIINRMARGDNSTLGFGAFYILYQNGYYVQRLTTGSPADLAGVKVGDKLLQFDGVAASQDAINRMTNAQEGKSYSFVFQRPGVASLVKLNLEFKRYNVPTIEWHMVGNHIGFITINAFHQDVATRLDETIAAAKVQGADSLVVDLRYNGGGYNFDKVAGRFVKDGEDLGTFTNRRGTSQLKAHSDGKQVDPPLPLVVLIDRNSASASEVFSLAVRDYKAGTLIGGKSAGAIGTVQYWPLGDGTMLGVTASEYETAKGEKLNGIGVMPDIQVTRSTADILAGRDPQLDAAVKLLESKAKTGP